MKKLIFLLCTLFSDAYAMEIAEVTRKEEQEIFVSGRQFINQITYAIIAQVHTENLEQAEKIRKAKAAQLTEKTSLIVSQKERDISCAYYGCLAGQSIACVTASITFISNNPDPCCASCCCCHIPISLGVPITAGLSIGGALISVISYIVLSSCCKD